MALNASPAAMQCSTSSPAAPLRAYPRVRAPAWRQQPRQLGRHQPRLCPKAAVDCEPGEAARQDSPAEVPRMDARLDDKLSMRAMELDPLGYFIVKVDRVSRQLVLEHYSNTIDKNGVACDPDSGEPIPCTAGHVRMPTRVLRGTTAKELSVVLLEQGGEGQATAEAATTSSSSESSGNSSSGSDSDEGGGGEVNSGSVEGDISGSLSTGCSGSTSGSSSMSSSSSGVALVSRLEHANYLGRELQRAEMALLMGWDYVQD